MKIRLVGAEFHAAGGADRNDEGNSSFSQYANSPNNRTSKHLLVSVVNTLLMEVGLAAWVPFPVRRVGFFFSKNVIHQRPVQQVSGACGRGVVWSTEE